MSSEHLVYDVETGGKVTVVREKPSQEGRWKCLSICSFLLLMGAVAVFAVLQFGAFRQSADQDAMEDRKSSIGGLPQTMKVQALASRKPVAHVIATLSDSSEMVWSEKVAPAMLEKIVLDREQNALVIPSDGLYFVYSQLMFHGTSCTSRDSLLLSHTVQTYSTVFNDKIDLLKSVKSVCESGQNSNLWFESIYQGGVFKLTRGDLLWSRTESAKYLDLSREGQNYFGVIALD
ncbi:tumor necrosis factor [Tiliqua scincoides]|uniref:tumor necrosis factor n=1 Tax=Tiliqua scincoides TaxID=71010 RepID=UPI00346332EB